MYNRVYFVYPGLGKTTLAQKNPKILDVETKIFKDQSLAQFIGRKDYPNYRGVPVDKQNPEWPNNLYKFVRNSAQFKDVLVLVPKKDGYDLLDKLGITDYTFIMPAPERLGQLRLDYINRSDDEQYINQNLGARYKEVLDYATGTGKEIIFVRPGEYLEDVIKL